MRFATALPTVACLALMGAGACGGKVVIDTIDDADRCSALTDWDVCEAEARCRWLVPTAKGCSEPTLPAAGCYTHDDCASDSDCRQGETCKAIAVDPCWYEACHLCASAASVCVP